MKKSDSIFGHMPRVVTFKGNGRCKIFKFEEDKLPEGRIEVYHRRGGLTREDPVKILNDRIVFRKPPQKGNKIIAVYTYRLK